jgi:hypothetical protein
MRAPSLDYLFFRDLAAEDLNQFYNFCPYPKFSNVRALTFCDVDLARRSVHKLFRSFPAIQEFTTVRTMRHPTVWNLIAEPEPGSEELPWPHLRTVTINVESDQTVAVEAIRERMRWGHSLSKLWIMGADGEIPDEFGSLENRIEVEEVAYPALWLEGIEDTGYDDFLFLPA